MDSSIFDHFHRSSSDKITINRKDFELVQGYLRKVLELMENFDKNEEEETQEVEEQFYAEVDEDPESLNDAPMSDINECEIDIKEEEITSSFDQALKVITNEVAECEEGDWESNEENFEAVEDSEEEKLTLSRSSGKRVIKPPAKFSASPLEIKRRTLTKPCEVKLNKIDPEGIMNNQQNGVVINNGRKEKRCDVCGKYFALSYYSEHKFIHELKRRNLQLKCKCCEFVTKSRFELRKHFGKMHPNNGIDYEKIRGRSKKYKRKRYLWDKEGDYHAPKSIEK